MRVSAGASASKKLRSSSLCDAVLFFGIKGIVVCLQVLLVGGNSNNGTNAGPFYWNANNTASDTNTNIGRRLCFRIVLVPGVLASWQKRKMAHSYAGR